MARTLRRSPGRTRPRSYTPRWLTRPTFTSRCGSQGTAAVGTPAGKTTVGPARDVEHRIDPARCGATRTAPAAPRLRRSARKDA